MEQNEILQRFQEYCERHGITDKEAASALRVSRQTITNWRNGKPIAKTNIRGILTFISVPPHPIETPTPRDGLLYYVVSAWPDLTAEEKAEVVAVIERAKEKKTAPAADSLRA